MFKPAFPPTPKTRQQIADYLGISTDTLYRRLKERDIQLPSGLIYPIDILEMFNKLGILPPSDWPSISSDLKINEK